MSLLSLLVVSCGDDPEEAPSASLPVEEVKKAPKVEERIPFYLAVENFDYVNGVLEGNQPLKGFQGPWYKAPGGTATVANGIATITGQVKMICSLDTSKEGIFGEYLDEKGFIGKDNTVLFISFYQQFIRADMKQEIILQVARRTEETKLSVQLKSGVHMRAPNGIFGMRVQHNSPIEIASPEPLNRRENLIILKIEFGYADLDRISYYYNPLPEDEDNPVDTVQAKDIAFDCFAVHCSRLGTMALRSLVLADNFEDAAMERFAD